MSDRIPKRKSFGGDPSISKKSKSKPPTVDLSAEELAALKKFKAAKVRNMAKDKKAAAASATAEDDDEEDEVEENEEEEEEFVEMDAENEFAAPSVPAPASKSKAPAQSNPDDEFAPPLATVGGVWKLGQTVKNVDLNILPIILKNARGVEETIGSIFFGGGAYHTKALLEGKGCENVPTAKTSEFPSTTNL
jgi:hypothetical protein